MELINNNFYILSGCGYPNYFNVISNSIRDLTINDLDATLIIIVDAEDFTLQEKISEINEFLRISHSDFHNYKIIVQTPSIEGWCLGNQKFINPSPQSMMLNTLISHYNVRLLDPEKIDSYDEYNKAQTSTLYLKEAAKEKGLRYTKNRPDIIADITYLEKLISRNSTTEHIDSIQIFLKTFSAI